MESTTMNDERLRELVIEYGDGLKAAIEVARTHTLADARTIMMEEFDDDMFPEQDRDGWAFWINGLRITRKQEARKVAWNYCGLDKDGFIAVSMRSLSLKRRPMSDDDGPTTKRPKLEEAPSPSRDFLEANMSYHTPRGIVESHKSDTNDALLSPVKQPHNDEHLTQSDQTDKEPPHTEMVGKEILVDDHTPTSDARNLNLSMDVEKQAPSTQANKSPVGGAAEKGDEDSTIEDEAPVGNDIKQRSKASNITDTDGDSVIDDLMALSTKSFADDESNKSPSVALADDDMDSDSGTDALVEESPKPKPKKSVSVEELLSSDNEDDDQKRIPNADVEVEVVTPEQPCKPHAEADAAMDMARGVLRGIETILDETKEHELFCAQHRRAEWTSELKALMQSDAPQTIVGVLGNTGVGKSSLLNALLDEAAVLPTSGSRGCTAAVVELVYNHDLLGDAEGTEAQGNPLPKEVPVYRGEIEFLKKEDWDKELKILLEECSNQEKYVYSRRPDANGQPVAAAAWAKIDQVYGGGTMDNFLSSPTATVFLRLSNNPRVVQLLTPKTPGAAYNVIPVEEGKVVASSEQAKAFLKPYAQTNTRERRILKKFAAGFRKKINDYVYRKGNGNLPQTWPLIRKVRIAGPWDVLSTGACLVDLPGVRDANAARAKVAETYIQNCTTIWIVASIKRAVDDGTAKELMGEQFKRRLLMDGQYGNVSFICTQTDDVEASETMRDHADVAKQVPGRWDQMEKLSLDLQNIEIQQNDKVQEEEELNALVTDAAEVAKVAKTEIQEFLEDAEGVDDVDDEELESLKASLRDAKALRREKESKLQEWRDLNAGPMALARRKCEKLQRQLKTYCAQVRNEYSKSCLQDDFRDGLKELYQKEDGDDANTTHEATQMALPEDFTLPVFCISANDYMKLLQIKPQSDGPPNTFYKAVDTQIPMLRNFVHATTSKSRDAFVRNYVESVGDLLDRVRLVATNNTDSPTGRTAHRLQQSFEHEIRKMGSKIDEISVSFQSQLQTKIERSLFPSLSDGARKGSKAAMTTVTSWGSSNRRSKAERTADKNGLHWATYFATVRRDGEFSSPNAGAVDMNQELLDPMERAFASDWQRIMDTSTRSLIAKSKVEVLKLSDILKGDLVVALTNAGFEQARLVTMMTAAARGSLTALNTAFGQMNEMSTNIQRELTRSLLPEIKERMHPSYEAAVNVPGGGGKFNRMKSAMDSTSRKAFSSMFLETLEKMRQEILVMSNQLARAIADTTDVMRRSYGAVLSICWDNAPTSKSATIDPELQQKMRECRDSFLPKLQDLLKVQKESSDLLGIERDDLDLDVMQVESFEEKLKKREQEARLKGNAFDLCVDSEVDMSVLPVNRIKAEPGVEPAAADARPASFLVGSNGVIDLSNCDSDSDDEHPVAPPAAMRQIRVKSDPAENIDVEGAPSDSGRGTTLRNQYAAIGEQIRGELVASSPVYGHL